MRALALATLLLAVHAAAQTHSPLQGALPDTIILSGGWEMTPSGSACTLTHAVAGGHQDLAIRGSRGHDQVQVGLILPPGAAYSAAVQLTVVAQTEVAQQIGRVTFTPTQGRMGTLLTADWPADRLFPRLAEAARINFYTPDQHLLRSVRLAGSAAAIASLERCLGLAASNSSPTIASSTAPALAPAPTPITDGGWVAKADEGGCSIVRRTHRGNEIALLYNRRGNLMLVLRLPNGPATFRNQRATVTVAPGSSIRDDMAPQVGEATLVAAHVGNARREPFLFGRLDPSILALDETRWNVIALAAYDDAGTSLTDRVDIAGITGAIESLRRCERELPE